MRLIDADALSAAVRKATVYHSLIPGNWWEGRPRELSREEIIKMIKEMPTESVQIEMEV